MAAVIAFVRRCISSGMGVEAALEAAEQFENGEGQLFLLPEELSAFADFWRAYPNKVGKRDAETSYNRAVKRARHQTIMEGLCRARLCRRWADGYIPNPATWLNQDRWLDEPDETPNPTPVSAGMLTAAARHEGTRRALEQLNGRSEAGGDLRGDQRALLPLPDHHQIP